MQEAASRVRFNGYS